MVNKLRVQRMASARVPVEQGEFYLHLYRNNRDGLDHLAFVRGELSGKHDVPTRLHSECFTGDVLGSLRCDCGPQLHEALSMIARRGSGVVVYLRQEGRGIGLLEKLRAYNLQDEGFDTVDANLRLGHPADAREYTTAALILEDLGVRSVELITNNPHKIDSLRDLGIEVSRRLPLEVKIGPENHPYMQTKILRMQHMLKPGELRDEMESWLDGRSVPDTRPLVTLAFAQSLDGSIAQEAGPPLLTDRLRRWHDGILVGIGTVLSDDPQLTVRLLPGRSPRPIVVDSRLRFPVEARMLDNDLKPWIATANGASRRGQMLKQRGASLLEVDIGPGGRVDLRQLLQRLRAQGVERLMVEGGPTVLGAFLSQQLADVAVVTIAPRLSGGLPALVRQPQPPKLTNAVWKPVGEEMVVWAELDWSS
ncbi:MAG: GTP cyclohydrolase II [Candidatus Eremiobacteraeota bacterium]|nr:GTP cyclohydrolase II [Candidatus Eremiobacteraeota bacterium]MCW5870939.1 GTP cyclohydrolase II [Candidatus Eremiobacteraeota bacterium]